MFRAKTMQVDEWAPVQEAMERLIVGSGGDPGYAMFIENNSASELDVVLLTEKAAALLEGVSPGGWNDCPDAKDRKWTLLAGVSDAHARLGLQSGR